MGLYYRSLTYADRGLSPKVSDGYKKKYKRVTEKFSSRFALKLSNDAFDSRRQTNLAWILPALSCAAHNIIDTGYPPEKKDRTFGHRKDPREANVDFGTAPVKFKEDGKCNRRCRWSRFETSQLMKR